MPLTSAVTAGNTFGAALQGARSGLRGTLQSLSESVRSAESILASEAAGLAVTGGVSADLGLGVAATVLGADQIRAGATGDEGMVYQAARPFMSEDAALAVEFLIMFAASTGGSWGNYGSGAAGLGNVRVYRVEGAPNSHVVIGESGMVAIKEGTQTVFFNFGSRARAEQYLAQKLNPTQKLGPKATKVSGTFDTLRAFCLAELRC